MLFILGPVGRDRAALVVDRQLVRLDVPIMIARLGLMLSWHFRWTASWEAGTVRFLLAGISGLHGVGSSARARKETAARSWIRRCRFGMTSDGPRKTRRPALQRRSDWMLSRGSALLVLGARWLVEGVDGHCADDGRERRS
ncbi:MAG: hypothetical protein MZV70_71865 [Desulfobacterales bacterium]|nr:hypothetical protein [Desulfobacterales bacterium]